MCMWGERERVPSARAIMDVLSAVSEKSDVDYDIFEMRRGRRRKKAKDSTSR